MVYAPDLAAVSYEKVISFSIGTVGDQVKAGYDPELVSAPTLHGVIILLWVVIYKLLDRSDSIWTVTYDSKRN